LEFGDVGFCDGRKTGEPGEKPSQQGENQQQTQPTYGAMLESDPATLVGTKSSHHWAIPTPQVIFALL